MKKVKRVLVIAIITVFVASCGVTRMNTAKTKDVSGPGVLHLPVLADLDVKPTKVSGTATGTLKATVTKLSIKQEAIANALSKVNGDILVEPFFKTEGVGRQYTVTVTGYPATYKNFRMMEEKDTTLYLVGNATTMHTSTAGNQLDNFTPKKKGKLIAGILIGGLVLALVPLILGL